MKASQIALPSTNLSAYCWVIIIEYHRVANNRPTTALVAACISLANVCKNDVARFKPILLNLFRAIDAIDSSKFDD